MALVLSDLLSSLLGSEASCGPTCDDWPTGRGSWPPRDPGTGLPAASAPPYAGAPPSDIRQRVRDAPSWLEIV